MNRQLRASLQQVLLVLLVCLTPLNALAISQNDRHAIDFDTNYFDPSATGCNATASYTGDATGTLPAVVPQPYNSIFTKWGNYYHVPPALLAAVFLNESGDASTLQFPDPPPPYGHGAPWPNSTDGHNSQGPFQFIPSTWQHYKDSNPQGNQNPEDLQDDTAAAAHYLADLGAKDTTSDSALQAAAKAYNGSGSAADAYAQTVMTNYHKILDSSGSQPASLNGPSPNPGPVAPPIQAPAATSDTLEGHKLPATKGGVGLEEAIDSSGEVASGTGKVTFSQFASKGQNYRDYYMNMRWRYADWNWDGTSVSGPEDFGWYNDQPRKVLITDPSTNKSIIAAVLEAGPAPWTGVDTSPNNSPKEGWHNPQDGTPSAYNGRVSGIAPKGFQALGAQERTTGNQGDDLLYAWAPDQNAEPGPTNLSVQNYDSASNGSCQDAGLGSNGGSIVQIAMQELNSHPTDGSKYGLPTEWCAAFVSWVYKQAGVPFTGGASGGWLITAAKDVENWFKNNGTWIPKSATADPPRPGDVVYYNWSGSDTGPVGGANDHVGIVKSVDTSSHTWTTINGNWGGTIGLQNNENYLTNPDVIGWGRTKN